MVDPSRSAGLSAISRIASQRQGRTAMQVQCVLNEELPRGDAGRIALLWQATWPAASFDLERRVEEILQRGDDSAAGKRQAPRFFLIRDAEAICAVAYVLPRTVLTAGGPLTVMGLAGVTVTPQRRGEGLGAAVVRSAFELVSDGVFAWSLFQTGEATRAFYQRLGARPVGNTFVNSKTDDPEANPWWEPVVMVYPGAPGWPEGEIDLNGPGY